ncbi:uncharacterized protein LOC118510827 [Anopheles stephensi]|uniref:uncharacterized protein LOC118510827 n=1 Tax=Anopheles stephensi TaxID=30069 RepID=UPI001658B4CF|nr:uncharacterized protein LOC118510827 [Anopheles stephensi]
MGIKHSFKYQYSYRLLDSIVQAVRHTNMNFLAQIILITIIALVVSTRGQISEGSVALPTFPDDIADVAMCDHFCEPTTPTDTKPHQAPSQQKKQHARKEKLTPQLK